MSDLLVQIRRDIDRRLDELRPRVDEFRRLEQERDALATSNASGPRRHRSGEGFRSHRTRISEA